VAANAKVDITPFGAYPYVVRMRDILNQPQRNDVMQLAFAMLARFADFARDGTLNIMGADFDQIEVPAFPCPLNVMLVTKLVPPDPLPPEPASFRIFITDPAGTHVQIPIPQNLATLPPPTARRQPAAVSVFNVSLYLHIVGTYQLHVNVDERDLAILPLNVSLAGRADTAPQQAELP
jgi:hypothetical protein